MNAVRLSRLLFAAAFVTFAAGNAVRAGAEESGGLLDAVGWVATGFGLLVMLPLSLAAHLVARRRRVGERLGVTPPATGDRSARS